MRVLVTHPGRQHSHQAALALEKTGRLAGYWTGVPAGGFGRYTPVPLDGRRVRSAPWTPGLRRAGDRLLPRQGAAWTDFAACRLFDRWAARGLPRLRPDAVIACEISASQPSAPRGGWESRRSWTPPRSTTRRRTAPRHGRPAGPPSPDHRVKDEEIALADHILTVSELARRPT